MVHINCIEHALQTVAVMTLLIVWPRQVNGFRSDLQMTKAEVQ